MNKSSEQSEWTLPSGSMVKINGHPYWIKGDVIVIGSTAPEHEAVVDIQGPAGLSSAQKKAKTALSACQSTSHVAAEVVRRVQED